MDAAIENHWAERKAACDAQAEALKGALFTAPIEERASALADSRHEKNDASALADSRKPEDAPVEDPDHLAIPGFLKRAPAETPKQEDAA